MDITAFMNLMVILVPFLLITAVFSRITVLELNLPGKSTGQNKPPIKELQLEVIIRKDRLEVADRTIGVLNRLPNAKKGQYKLDALARTIRDIKGRFPKMKNITILLEPQADYNTLVQVMDRVRMTEQRQNGEFVKVELFPNISIGDAPVLSKPSQQGSGS